MWLNYERSFFENRRNCSPSELHGGGLFKTFNSYSFNFNGGLRKRRMGYCLLRTPSPRGKQFLWFLKNLPLAISSHLSPLWLKDTFVFKMCLLRINLPNLCPNMNHFDAVDFSECHSEEVISFFWRSVYMRTKVSIKITNWNIHTCTIWFLNKGIHSQSSTISWLWEEKKTAED